MHSLLKIGRRVYQLILRRAFEKVIQQVHVPGSEDDQDSVLRLRRDALDVPEDLEVAVEPAAGLETHPDKIGGLVLILERSGQVVRSS